MIDKLQYKINEYFKKRSYLRDRPKNKHLKMAKTIVLVGDDGRECKPTYFTRVSYNAILVCFGDDLVTSVRRNIKIHEIEKIIDDSGNLVWKKTNERHEEKWIKCL